MSDINIPGVNDKYGTQKLIAGLMKVQRFKLTEMEDARKGFESDKGIWQGLNRRMHTVRDAAQLLYGFNSPFGAKLGTSSDDSILTVQASRRSVDGQYTVKVTQIATGDRFLSKSLPLDVAVPEGDYVFKVGDKNILLPFHGSKLSELVDLINSKGDGKLKAVLVKDTETSQVMQIETVGVGAKNRLGLDDASKNLMTRLGVIGPSDSHDLILVPSPVEVPPQSQKTWQVPSALPTGGQLEIRYKVQDLPPASPPPVSSGFSFPDPGAVDFRGLKVQNSPMKGDLPQPTPPSPPAVVDDLKIFSIEGNGSTVALPPVQDGTEQTLTLPVSSFPAGPANLVSDNKNTGRSVSVESVKIIDPSTRGDWKPLNPVTRAQDAELDYEGIKIIRDSNTLSDVIPGTTLNLVSTSDKTVQIKVEPDRKSIKDGVIAFLVQYNKLITDLNVLTGIKSPDPANAEILQDATYYTDEEKKQAEKNLGRYQGDISLNTEKNMLQRAMMNPYGSPGQTPYTLLAQVGISTNETANAGSSQVNVSKLRGYLELDDAKFDTAVEKDPQSVRALFGAATHGDFVVDNGAAFQVDRILKPYTDLGGFNDSKLASLDSNIKDENRQMDTYKDYLSRYEQDLKVKYGNMESTLDSMQKSAADINNIGR